MYVMSSRTVDIAKKSRHLYGLRKQISVRDGKSDIQKIVSGVNYLKEIHYIN